MLEYLTITLSILIITLWFWALIDIAGSRFKNHRMNTVWLWVVIFFPVVGSIFYLLLRKDLTTNKPRRFQPDFNRA